MILLLEHDPRVSQTRIQSRCHVLLHDVCIYERGLLPLLIVDCDAVDRLLLPIPSNRHSIVSRLHSFLFNRHVLNTQHHHPLVHVHLIRHHVSHQRRLALLLDGSSLPYRVRYTTCQVISPSPPLPFCPVPTHNHAGHTLPSLHPRCDLIHPTTPSRNTPSRHLGIFIHLSHTSTETRNCKATVLRPFGDRKWDDESGEHAICLHVVDCWIFRRAS
jgi:hypothetical protein